MQSDIVSWIIFVMVLSPSIAFAVNFSRKMWIEILKVVAGKSAKAFRFMTCGTKEITLFKLQYMDDGNSEEEEDQVAVIDGGETRIKGGARALRGFAAPTVDYSKSFSENLAKSEKNEH